MDNFENLTSAQPESNGLQNQIDSLRRLVITGLVMVLLLSVTVNLYLWRQYRTAAADASQLSLVVNEYYKWVQQFSKNLTEYSHSHPDFAPIVSKYHIGEAPKAATPASKTAPVPAKAPTTPTAPTAPTSPTKK
jgi:hypothetical protein